MLTYNVKISSFHHAISVFTQISKHFATFIYNLLVSSEFLPRHQILVAAAILDDEVIDIPVIRTDKDGCRDSSATLWLVASPAGCKSRWWLAVGRNLPCQDTPVIIFFIFGNTPLIGIQNTAYTKHFEVRCHSLFDGHNQHGPD